MAEEPTYTLGIGIFCHGVVLNGGDQTPKIITTDFPGVINNKQTVAPYGCISKYKIFNDQEMVDMTNMAIDSIDTCFDEEYVNTKYIPSQSEKDGASTHEHLFSTNGSCRIFKDYKQLFEKKYTFMVEGVLQTIKFSSNNDIVRQTVDIVTCDLLELCTFFGKKYPCPLLFRTEPMDEKKERKKEEMLKMFTDSYRIVFEDNLRKVEEIREVCTHFINMRDYTLGIRADGTYGPKRKKDIEEKYIMTSQLFMLVKLAIKHLQVKIVNIFDISCNVVLCDGSTQSDNCHGYSISAKHREIPGVAIGGKHKSKTSCKIRKNRKSKQRKLKLKI